MERYLSSWEGHMAVRLRFRLKLGLFEDKRKCSVMEEHRVCAFIQWREGERW